MLPVPQSWTGWDYKPYYGITVGAVFTYTLVHTHTNKHTETNTHKHSLIRHQNYLCINLQLVIYAVHTVWLLPTSITGWQWQYLVWQWNSKWTTCQGWNFWPWIYAVYIRTIHTLRCPGCPEWVTECLLLILSPISSCVQALSRTYAQSVAGLTQTMAYNHMTQDFTLVYIIVKECTSTVSEVASALGL